MVCKKGLFNDTISLERLPVLELQDRSAVSWLRPFTTGTSLRRPSCYNLRVYVGFVEDYVAARQAYLRVLSVSQSPRHFPPFLRTHILATEGVVET
jgi:hypothetical protein